MLLVGAGHETGHIHEGDDRDVEAVAEADEARRLVAGIDVEHPGQHARLIGDDADAVPAQAREADDDIRGEILVDLEEDAVVDDRA